MNSNSQAQLKLAELASTLGAGILGFGLGIYFIKVISLNVYLILLIGIALHLIGMFLRHKFENRTDYDGLENKTPIWITVVYWLCWMLIGAFLIFLLIINKS